MSDLMSDEQVASRLHESVSKQTVRDRWKAGRWPYTQVGRFRGMTEQQFQEVLAIEAIAATNLPAGPSRSGLSPRTRHKRAS